MLGYIEVCNISGPCACSMQQADLTASKGDSEAKAVDNVHILLLQ